MMAAREHAASGNYLFFEIGDSRFCAPVNDVEAIVELHGIHGLPFAPKGIAGTFMFRDRVAVVCDLGAVLNVEADAARKDLSVVVKLPIGLVAFRVDHVSDIVAASDIHPQLADERAMKEWMDGYVMQGPHIAFLTSFEKLLSLFGVASLASLAPAARGAEPPQPDVRTAAVEPVAARGVQAATVTAPAPVPVDSGGHASRDGATVAPIESAAEADFALQPEEDAAVAMDATVQPAQAATHEPAQSSVAQYDAAAAPEVAEPAVEFAAEIDESLELAPEAEVLRAEAPAESPPQPDVTAYQADVEPAADAGGVPEIIAFESESAARPHATPAAELSPDSAQSPEDLPEQEPPASIPEMQPIDAPASLMQESERETSAVAEPVEEIDGEALDATLSTDFGEAPLAAEDVAESPVEPEYSESSRHAAETLHPNRRKDVVCDGDFSVNSDEAAPSTNWNSARYRSTPAPERRERSSGKRSYVAIAIAAALLPLAFAGGWWWFSRPAVEQAPQPRQVAATEAAHPQQAAGAIEPRPSKLEIVGKDFEMRVEPAPSGRGKESTPAPAARDEIVVVVVRGDTLWDIAAKHLGNPHRYPELARNSAIRNPDLIHPGDVVRIRKRR
jgi:chemotaxis signal transduction protein